MTVPSNIEEIHRRIMEKEAELGVSKGDSKLLEPLTDLQYLFVLEWCDPSFIVTSKAKWAEAKGFRRNEVYNWLSANPKTTKAVAYLQNKLAQNQCVQVSKVVYEKALEGNMTAAKMYLEHFKPDVVLPSEETGEEEWDMTPWEQEKATKNQEDRPKKPTSSPVN